MIIFCNIKAIFRQKRGKDVVGMAIGAVVNGHPIIFNRIRVDHVLFLELKFRMA